jgi:hypothetical protein
MEKIQTSQVLADVLNRLGKIFEEDIFPEGREYVLVDIGAAYRELGNLDDAPSYDGVVVVVPLKKPIGKGLAIEVDASGFDNYVQLESGLAVIKWVADKSGLKYEDYQHPKTMILYGSVNVSQIGLKEE